MNITNVMTNTTHVAPINGSTMFGIVICAVSTLFQAALLILM